MAEATIPDQHVMDFKKFYGECDCGWIGENFDSYEDAMNDAYAHRVAAHADTSKGSPS